MTPEDIRTLAAECARSGILEIELNDGDFQLHLRFSKAAPASSEVVVEMPGERERQKQIRAVSASGVGIFRHAHPTTGRKMIEPGQVVFKGQIVGFLRVGDCLRPILSKLDGTLAEILAQDGMVAGYGTRLYRLE